MEVTAMKKLVASSFLIFVLLFVAGCGNQTEQVVIPQSFFSEEELDNIIKEMEVEGEVDVTMNEDGNLVYNMPKDEYDEMMEEFRDNIDDMIEDVLEDETLSAVNDISVNNRYNTFDVTVDRAVFEESFQGMFILGLGISGVMYQTFDNTSDSDSVTFNFIDQATGDVYDTVVYPDALEEME